MQRFWINHSVKMFQLQVIRSIFYVTNNQFVWFTGMALTAMCFNVVHDELIHRLKHQERSRESIKKTNSTSFSVDDIHGEMSYNIPS